jgi:Transglycosylase SLT domain
MANFKRSPVSYRQFSGQAILADGLLAVQRPGGEVEQAIANSFFGVAEIFREKAERTSQRKGEQAGQQAALAALPRVDIGGGEKRQAIAGHDGRVPAAPTKIRDVITAAAGRYGVSPTALLRVADLESNFDPKAKNPKSSASGLFQGIDTTHAQYGVADPFDEEQSADFGARLMRDNTNYLRKKLGRDPTVGELYLAHQQGAAGALRLLENPNARAVNIVGADAVTLNGGDAEMTAAEFAQLWTAKAGDAPVGEGLGPIAMRAPLEIEATGGKLEMAGRDTIFGRAYDAAAGGAYRKALEDEMLSASDQLFQKYQDDPEELRVAFADLKRAQLAEHVPEAIRLDYELAFGGLERGYLAKAQKGREEKIKLETKVQFDAREKSYSDALSRAEAGLDPENPASFDILQGEAARLKQHWREGVANDIITPQAAAEASANLDGDVAMAYHLKQAEGQAPDDIRAYQEKLKADYAAGKLEGVDGRAWAKLHAALATAAREQEIAISAATTKLAKSADGILTRAASGYDIPAIEIAELRKAAVGVEDGDAIVSSTLQVLDMARMLRHEPIGAAEAKVKDLREQLGDAPTAIDIALVDTAEAMIAKARASLATDLLGHAERLGVVDATGNIGDAKTADDFAGLLQLRVDAADQAAKHFGVEPRYFKPGEVQGLEALIAQDPVAGAAIAAGVIRGAGDRATDVLKEFGATAPLIAGAGAILADGGDVRAAQDAIAGGGKDASGKAYSDKGWQKRRTTAEEMTGAAFVSRPEEAARVTGTAERIARKRIDDAGVEPDSEEADKITRHAVNEAAGAVYDGETQWGGFADYDPGFWKSAQKVVVPNTIRADRFADVIDALRDDDFLLAPLGGLAELQRRWPVLTNNGYVFVDFDAEGNPLPLGDVRGGVFTLHLDRLAPQLSSRVPGAFRGY